MQESFYHRIFKTSKTPVVVCQNAIGYPVIYANPSAALLFYWWINGEVPGQSAGAVMLSELFGEEYQHALQAVVHSILLEGQIDRFFTNVRPKGGDPIAVSISGNWMEEEAAFILYFQEEHGEKPSDKETVGAISANSVISVILNECVQTIDVGEAINQILSITGQYLQVSRAYIVEDQWNDSAKNTYEWCREGVEPSAHYLQSFLKKDYFYSEIVTIDKFIYDDVRDMAPHPGKEFLEMKGVRAIALFTLFRGNDPIGYLGVEDCDKTRKWSRYEIQSMEQISRILTSLLEKRQVQQKEKQNLHALKTILDYFDQIIYVSDPKTNKVVFINRFLAELLGKDAEEVIGKPCFEVLQLYPKPCALCPQQHLLTPDGKVMRREYTWEWENPHTGRWFQIKDSIIKWFDDRDVHMEIATDITDQKEYEKTLEHYASTDMMTGLLNRDWGCRVIQDVIDHRKDEDMCICFIDVDGLKKANDNLGHQIGDKMLVHIVTSIRTAIRSSDIMCRWGGDEFLGLMHCNEMQARQLMKRVISKLKKMNQDKQLPYKLSISYGLVSVNEHPDRSMEELVSIADSRMYEQKMGKSR